MFSTTYLSVVLYKLVSKSEYHEQSLADFNSSHFICAFCLGQSVNEIINEAITKTGGASNWAALKGIKIKAKFDQGGIEFPLEIVQLADGRQYPQLTFQNTEIKQGVFDGNTLWSTDFQTLKAKLAIEETTANVSNDSNDFPDALLNYSRKGYEAEL